MHDGKALQSATSHYFGDGFAKAFDITFQGRDNQLHHPYETSWGMSTRIIGAIIMTHGDDNGQELRQKLSAFCRVKTDGSDNSPGWKFAEYEMKGVPLRLEFGPRDIEAGQCVLVRRDNREKTIVKLDELETKIPELLQAVHDGLYERALKNRQNRTFTATTFEEMKRLASEESGFIETMWCGDLECEMKVKEEAGLTSRCMPDEQKHIGDVCPICGKPAKHSIIWGKAY